MHTQHHPAKRVGAGPHAVLAPHADEDLTEAGREEAEEAGLLTWRGLAVLGAFLVPSPIRLIPDCVAVESQRKKCVQCVNVVYQANPCARTEGKVLCSCTAMTTETPTRKLRAEMHTQ